MRSFDVAYSFLPQKQHNRSNNPPERTHAVAVPAIVPVERAIVVDAANMASLQRITCVFLYAF